MNHGTLQTCFSPSWGGLEMVAFEVAERMSQAGFYIKTACTPNSPLAERLVAANLDILPVQRRHKYFAPSVVSTLRNELKTGRYSSVLVEQLNELWQVVPAMRAMPDLKLVGISHTLVGIPKRDYLHRLLYGRVDHLIALTSIHKQNLLQNLPVKESAIPIIPNAVDLKRFNPDRRSSEIRNSLLKSPNTILICVVSRIDRAKGLREVITAARELRALGLDFKVVIAGRETIGEEGTSQVLLNDIASANLQDYVELVGHRADVESLVASSDILLMPSPNETFGRVLIEAMASNIAVIASSGGGVPDIIEPNINGLLYTPMNVEAMVTGLTQLIRDSEFRQKIAAGGFESAHTRFDQKILDSKLYRYLGLLN